MQTGSKIRMKQLLSGLAAALILVSAILHTTIIGPATVQAAGTGGIKGTLLPAGYVTQRQMKLAVPWAGMDESALYNVMRKAQSGQKVTIAFIGGSITKGTVSRGTRDGTFRKKLTYVDYFSDWWYKKFPRADLRFVNAGISATDSYLGVHRVQNDVLAKKPDLVVVEFAVNDKKTSYHKQAYENLVRKILAADSKPAVMLLFMSKLNGKNCQLQQSQIGKHYNLPMVSYANVMKDMVSKGIYTIDELSGDGIHPSALGYAVTGEILVRYLNGIWEKSLGQVVSKKAASSYVTSKNYSNPKILTCKDIKIQRKGTFYATEKNKTFQHNLTCSSGNGDLVFTVNCKDFGLIYAKQVSGSGGRFDVYVDGKKAATIDANYEGRHNFADAVPCYSSSTKKQHTVRIVKSKNSIGRTLTVLGVLTSS